MLVLCREYCSTSLFCSTHYYETVKLHDLLLTYSLPRILQIIFLLLALYYSDYRDFGISTALHNANFASPSIKKIFRLQRL